MYNTEVTQTSEKAPVQKAGNDEVLKTPREMALGLVNSLSDAFIGREEEAKLAVIALSVKGHACFIGEPGTAKSALFRRLSDAVSGKYYYYLMSKYTIPDEIIGPIDPVEYKNGKFTRMVSGKMPTANISFIDEVFKASSETLNTLLNIMNERSFVDIDGKMFNVPLYSMFSASNELPESEELQAFFDRILIKHFVKPIDPSGIEAGILANINGIKPMSPITLNDIDTLNGAIRKHLESNAQGIAKTISSMVTVMRQHGIFISDRTAMGPNYLPMLVAAHSYIFNSPVKKSAISMSKYILTNNEDALTNYSKALDSLYPPELRMAQEKLEKAFESAQSGNIGDAKSSGVEAMSQIQAAAGKQSVLELYADEIVELTDQAGKFMKQIEDLQSNLKSFKKVA
ncbi:MAG: AAA family ATPase [Cuniculiplasma sp.]